MTKHDEITPIDPDTPGTSTAEEAATEAGRRSMGWRFGRRRSLGGRYRGRRSLGRGLRFRRSLGGRFKGF